MKEHKSVKKKLASLVLLTIVSFTLSGCGRYALDINSQNMKEKSYKAEPLLMAQAFREKTFGSVFSRVFADALVHMANPYQVSSGAPDSYPVSPDKQGAIDGSDPTPEIFNGVLNHLTKNYGWKKVSKTSVQPDYTIRLDSSGWGTSYNAIKPDSYDVYYGAQFLIREARGKDAKSLSVSCRYVSKDEYHYNSLFENNAHLIKYFMKQAETECAEQLIRKLNDAIADGDKKVKKK